MNTTHGIDPPGKGKYLSPSLVMPFSGLLISDLELVKDVESRLTKKFGPVVKATEPYEWSYSSYYKEEMGEPLWRKFLFFRHLIHPGSLGSIKVWSNLQERIFRGRVEGGSQRRINIDPGYLDRSKVVLASTKDPGHRLYLGNGIYGEVTLIYRAGTYQPYDYTYRDLSTPQALAMFNEARKLYLKHLREESR